MKQTILHIKHIRLKAKMADYQGWQMPQQYAEVHEEYHAVRDAAGLFDVSCLGRIEVTGSGAEDFLQKIVTYNLVKIPEKSVQHCLICNDAGFILDDILLFRLPASRSSGNRFLLSTSAGNVDKTLNWLKQRAGDDVKIIDQTQTFAQLSLQGPNSAKVLAHLAGQQFKKFKRAQVREMLLLDTNMIVSRSGYTGEHGYELIVPADHAEALWDALLRLDGVVPCGFASRNILRIEMGFLMYGQDIDETHTPIEANLTSLVDFNKDFIGKDALQKLKTEGMKQKLAGFILLDKNMPKCGGSIFSESREIGRVTSCGTSPRFRNGIGLGYVTNRYAQLGQEIEVEIRDKEVTARVVELPFYRKK